MKLKQEVAEILRMKAVMSKSARVQAFSDRAEDDLTSNILLTLVKPIYVWELEGGFGGGYSYLHVNCSRA